MKILSFLGTLFISATILASAGTVLLSAPAYAAEPSCTPSADSQCVDVCGNGGSEGTGDETRCNEFIDKYINPIIKVLTALVGIAAVISIIVAGIQYGSSADDSGAVTKAKQRIFNTVIGLVAYIFLLAFLNWLIPGGVF